MKIHNFFLPLLVPTFIIQLINEHQHLGYKLRGTAEIMTSNHYHLQHLKYNDISPLNLSLALFMEFLS